MEYPEEISVVAAVIIRADGRILCARRGNAKNPCVAWKWEFPGGKIDSGETPEEALVREIREEMDYPISIREKLIRVNHAYPNIRIKMDAFLCSPENEHARPDLREHTEIAWLFPKELPSLDWAEADKPIVNFCIKRFC